MTAPTTFTHKSDAEHWLLMQERAIERGEWRSPEEVEASLPVVHTLQETYERFLAQRPRPLALSTATAYEQDWRLRIVPHWGTERDVRTITMMTCGSGVSGRSAGSGVATDPAWPVSTSLTKATRCRVFPSDTCREADRWRQGLDRPRPALGS
ncbi:hypothetical protein H5392_04185 [Tessaracoccus sp. MC1865]|uniref:hypothetical protein n=1 Tax=Tessaracoccus sp. MC1865 TaxID=2760310 RepID=UPI0015FF3D91|nr:hypothetical protein [Tessaracoccus sp. MC1865]MBB1483059.1 hypothetical protein [Tessaracoccus sp. MC1865]QTO37510.1 hypothetical protein J7D54_14030 [Tessaracoccus sp. MC1865]